MWISGQFDQELWTHFDHSGPRTTNLAEGYHNSLNKKFGMPHPSLRSFLDWLQKAQFEVQCQVIQLSASQPAKQKSAVYVSDRQRKEDHHVERQVSHRSTITMFVNSEEGITNILSTNFTTNSKAGRRLTIKIKCQLMRMERRPWHNEIYKEDPGLMCEEGQHVRQYCTKAATNMVNKDS